MISEGKQKFTKQILICGVAVNLILNSIGIPVFGMNGAAAATFITELTCCLIAPLIIKETRVFVTYIITSLNPLKILDNRKG